MSDRIDTSRPTLESIERPWWQDKPCPPWCEGGHDAAEHPEDRTHFGPLIEQTLSLCEEASDRWIDQDGAPCVYPPTLSGYLRQGWREGEAAIELSVNDRPGLCMTLAEAARLQATLDEMLRAASKSSSS